MTTPRTTLNSQSIYTPFKESFNEDANPTLVPITKDQDDEDARRLKQLIEANIQDILND
jgi:hypothetical protein